MSPADFEWCRCQPKGWLRSWPLTRLRSDGLPRRWLGPNRLQGRRVDTLSVQRRVRLRTRQVRLERQLFVRVDPKQHPRLRRDPKKLCLPIAQTDRDHRRRCPKACRSPVSGRAYKTRRQGLPHAVAPVVLEDDLRVPA